MKQIIYKIYLWCRRCGKLFFLCLLGLLDLLKKYTTTSSLKQCIICGRDVAKFLSEGNKNEIFSHHHIIGGGYRENCRCPYCGATDRERWLYYVLQNKLGIFKASGRILHFAPEGSIQKNI